MQNSVFTVFADDAGTVNFVRGLSRRCARRRAPDAGEAVRSLRESSSESRRSCRRTRGLYEAHITTRCDAASTFDGIVFDAFDQLNRYATSIGQVERRAALQGEPPAGLIGLKSHRGAGRQSGGGDEGAVVRLS